MAAKAGLTGDGDKGQPDVPGGGSTPAGQGRTWVWHSTLDSRKAGRVSVLAWVETLFAVVLYWWIAISYDTHLHLLSSVIIAPLLLLRSPESMAAGVRWFLKDWVGLESYRWWPRGNKACWIIAAALVSALPTYFLAHFLTHRWLPGLDGWPLLGWAAAIGALSVAVAVAAAFASAGVGMGAIAGADAGTRASAGSVAGLVAGSAAAAVAAGGSAAGSVAAAGSIAIVGSVAGSIVVAYACRVVAKVAIEGAGPGIGVAIAMRALFFRVAATLRYWLAGICRLPENWRENNFLTDSSLPAELMPGIRDSAPLYSLDGFRKRFSNERRSIFALYPVFGVAFFVPPFFYRLNIKATAWFWWPLAYLLKPAPLADAEGQQKQALCWPWTDPFKMLWIVVSVLLMLVSLTLHNLEPASWAALKNIPALPLVLKVSLAISWAHYAPWHWAQWIIAGAGAGMLALAGNARSHDLNGNWRDYRSRWPRNIRLMIGLQRLRTLATISLLLMALGALLLQDRAWQRHVRVPERWIQALEQFYRIQR